MAMSFNLHILCVLFVFTLFGVPSPPASPPPPPASPPPPPASPPSPPASPPPPPASPPPPPASPPPPPASPLPPPAPPWWADDSLSDDSPSTPHLDAASDSPPPIPPFPFPHGKPEDGYIPIFLENNDGERLYISDLDVDLCPTNHDFGEHLHEEWAGRVNLPAFLTDIIPSVAWPGYRVSFYAHDDLGEDLFLFLNEGLLAAEYDLYFPRLTAIVVSPLQERVAWFPMGQIPLYHHHFGVYEPLGACEFDLGSPEFEAHMEEVFEEYLNNPDGYVYRFFRRDDHPGMIPDQMAYWPDRPVDFYYELTYVMATLIGHDSIIFEDDDPNMWPF